MATKTTFYLSDDLRARLKGLAARRGTTMSELLAEGAEAVLARHQGGSDKDELERMAREAELTLRAGLFAGPSTSDRLDEIVYGGVTPKPRGGPSPRARGSRPSPPLVKRRALFYDTWGWVALANAHDEGHAAAAEGDEWRERHGYALVTSDYVLDETITALQRSAGAKVTTQFIDLFTVRQDAGRILLAEVTRDRRLTAIELFRRLAPRTPGLSFTDCTSFGLMHELGIAPAFTIDRHFLLAGLRPTFALVRSRPQWRPPSR